MRRLVYRFYTKITMYTKKNEFGIWYVFKDGAFYLLQKDKLCLINCLTLLSRNNLIVWDAKGHYFWSRQQIPKSFLSNFRNTCMIHLYNLVHDTYTNKCSNRIVEFNEYLVFWLGVFWLGAYVKTNQDSG